MNQRRGHDRPGIRRHARLAAVLGLLYLVPGFFEDILQVPAQPRVLAQGPEAAKTGEDLMIEHIDLVHFSHTDFGFTDHPVVCRELYRRYLDIAVDAVLATQDGPEEEKFCWTAETIVPVCDWWEAAAPPRREEFLKAVRSGRLEIAALPLNQTPTLNRRQWHTMLHWIPEDLWRQLDPKVAIQSDVNGVPRAAAAALLDRGIRFLLMSINSDSGGAPLKRPSAFWWKMPDGQRMFVWLNYSYPQGFYFFESRSWRQGPLPRAADTRYRPPTAGDFLNTDEASLRKAHEHLLGKLKDLQSGGYSHRTLLLSMTNEWRMDNDPPFPPLAKFVAAWNRLGLKPSLRLTTPSVALKRQEEEIGREIPQYEGEWTDWWANGVASGPREVAASRFAKRMLAAAESPLWGELDDNALNTLDEIYKELCLFDEHTWGGSNSVALPDCLDTIGQYTAKAGFAYRAMARAQWFLSQRVRTRLIDQGEGLYLANTSKLPFSGWIRMPVTCFRGDFKSVEDTRSGAKSKFYLENGPRPFVRPRNAGELTPETVAAATFPDNCPGQVAKFWVEKLEGGTIRTMRLKSEAVEADQPPQAPPPSVNLDQSGWPASVSWQGMKKPLFTPGFGDFMAVKVKGFAPRWILKDVFGNTDDRQREELRAEHLEEVPAVAEGKAAVEQNPHTTVYSQALSHPRLRWASRRLEIWNRQPRARYTLSINRISSEAPEFFFVVFPLPCEGTQPLVSNGGLPFVPYEDQLPGTCRDYFSIDGWVQYETADGNWLWVSRDAPLVTFGSSGVKARRKDPPKETHRVLAMIYENGWYTNFVGDSHGVMEFQFDLAWKDTTDGPSRPEDLAQSLLTEPQVMINPALREGRIVIERLYKP